MKYEFEAGSPSDKSRWLGFATAEAAQAHADRMNALLRTFDDDPSWNREFWKVKPAPWVARTR